MKQLHVLAAWMLISVSSLWSASAAALWMGLDDGDYSLTLTSCINNSNPSVCAGIPASGQMTVSGTGLSFVDLTFDGVAFIGDPVDFVQDPFITPGDVRERSSFSNSSPFSFFSLLHEIGTLGPSLPFTNAYIYCNNSAIGTCTPSTVGQWTATRLSAAVPEPSVLALLSMALAGIGMGRRKTSRA